MIRSKVQSYLTPTIYTARETLQINIQMLQDILSRYCLPRAARAVVRPYHCIMLCLFIENKMFPFDQKYFCKAIEEKSLEALDHTDFVDTDIPSEIPLPDTLYVSVSILLFKKI